MTDVIPDIEIFENLESEINIRCEKEDWRHPNGNVEEHDADWYILCIPHCTQSESISAVCEDIKVKIVDQREGLVMCKFCPAIVPLGSLYRPLERVKK